MANKNYLVYVDGSEADLVSVQQSLLQRLPGYRSWSPQKKNAYANNCMKALKKKREHDLSVSLLPYFPVPVLGDNDPYTECFDGTEKTYADVKQKLQRVYPEWCRLKGDTPVQITTRCLKNLELARDGPGPSTNETPDLTIFHGFEKTFLEVKRTLQMKSPYYSTLSSKGRQGYTRKCLRDLKKRQDDREETHKDNLTIPGRYIKSSSAESTRSEHSCVESLLRPNSSLSEMLSEESGPEDLPGRELQDMVVAHPEAPVEDMQRSVAREIEDAERKYVQRITELEAENAEVRAENGEIKTENSALKDKMKKLVAELGRITMDPHSLESMRSDITPPGYKPLKFASDAVFHESAADDDNQGGANKYSGSSPRKRTASEVSESAETPSTRKKKKHKSSKKKAANGVD